MLRHFIFLSGLLLFLLSCQKELSNDTSIGSLQKISLTGICDPAAVNGLFIKDSTLTNDNYVDVKVNVLLGGSFDIRTDTVNGFSFRKTGVVVSGINTIRLYPSGKPLAAGITKFTVNYGSSTCTFNIEVIDRSGGTAVYTLENTSGNCDGFSSSGSYVAGTALGASNTVSCRVNVTSPGTYSLNTATVNGIRFSASGLFTSAGIQTVVLTGTGTPLASGNFNFTPVAPGNSCSFTITVTGSLPPSSIFVLGGSPGACTGVVLSGNYQAGVSTTSANTAKVDVTVTTPGSYSLVTNIVNGIKFSGSGIFSSTGAQSVTLTATPAVPATAGAYDYSISGATSSSCNFAVTYAAAPPPAAYTLSGAPGACANISVNGTYQAGTPLSNTHNVVVEVNVTVPGAYSISTNSQNGMQFSAAGLFTATGIQTVTLQPAAGSTPQVAGTHSLTVSAPSGSCSFNITTGTASDRVYSFKIGSTSFSGPCGGTLFNTGGSEDMLLIDMGTPGVSMNFNLLNPAGAITTGFYSGTSTAVKHASINYQGSISFLADPGATGLTNLSATVTAIDPVNRVIQGTFSGTVVDVFLNVLTVTNGSFKADY